MTYRIDRDGAHALAFEGLLDDAALEDLRAQVIPGRTRLHLRAGTEVDPVALDALRALPLAAIDAASPYLARRLTQDP